MDSGAVRGRQTAHARNRRSRRLLPTTKTELNAIAAPAIIGLRREERNALRSSPNDSWLRGLLLCFGRHKGVTATIGFGLIATMLAVPAFMGELTKNSATEAFANLIMRWRSCGPELRR